MVTTRLANGVRVVSERVRDAASVTVGIWVESGSRYERAEDAGISHFLEHLLFKGTSRRSAAEIAQEIDALGGALNAFTAKEYTCYYVKVLREHLTLGLDLLVDIFTDSQFPPAEIERERSVVIQEIAQVEDTPDEYVHELFTLAFWPEHPLGRPITGTPQTVSRIRRDELLAFLAARYRADRVLIAAAGDIEHDSIVDAVGARFGGLVGVTGMIDGSPPHARAGVAVHERRLEQAHLCLGCPGIALTDEDRYAAHLLSTVLGGGMSSRLFQEIRERRGKAYTVYSFVSSFRDSGYVGVYVGTSGSWVREVVEVIRDEFTRVVHEGLQAAELERAKNQLKGSMLLGLETSDSRMSRIAKNEIYFGRDVPVAEVAASVDAVSHDDITRVASRLFRPGTFALTVLGDTGGEPLGDEVLHG
jgi:predicted Zn-dependent peptidase